MSNWVRTLTVIVPELLFMQLMHWPNLAEKVLDKVFGEKHCYNAIEWDRAGKPPVTIWN